MKPIKNEWLIIKWAGKQWIKHTKPVKSFPLHKEEWERTLKLAKESGEDLRLYKSIHKSWLDDIANWESPFDPEVEAAMDKIVAEHSDTLKRLADGPPFDLDKELAKLNPHDRREVRNFQRFLRAKAKYGIKELAKRPVWRKYMNLKDREEADEA